MGCRDHHTNKESEIIKIKIIKSSCSFQFSTLHKVRNSKLWNKFVKGLIFHLLTKRLKIIGLVEELKIISLKSSYYCFPKDILSLWKIYLCLFQGFCLFLFWLCSLHFWKLRLCNLFKTFFLKNMLFLLLTLI